MIALFGSTALSSIQDKTLPFGKLQPFTTDYCSQFPEGTAKNKNKWAHCCFYHDKDYWMGGSYQERHESDLRLYQCVKMTGEPEVAYVMYSGVRAGGSPFIKTPWRWGYGWTKLRGYTPLDKQEIDEVAKIGQNLN